MKVSRLLAVLLITFSVVMAGCSRDSHPTGNQEQLNALAAAGASVHGVVWFDMNYNGAFDGFEVALQDVIVFCDTDDNGLLDPGEPSTNSMVDGTYWLEGLPVGPHKIIAGIFLDWTTTVPVGGFYAVDLVDGQTVEGLDFGLSTESPDGGSIRGQKYVDVDGDGVKDNDEPGLAGVIIYLDANNNGVFDDGELSTTTMEDSPNTVSDETGQYRFYDLPETSHIWREVVPPGYTQTEPASGFHSGLLTAEIHVIRGDFGNYPPQVEPGSIHGWKWVDEDGDGEWDNDEPGLAGVIIYADLNGNDAYDNGEPSAITMADVDSTTVDETGMYWLEGLLPDDYVIREVVPNLYEQTFPSDGEHDVVLEEGATVEDVNFGNKSVPSAEIHGLKWEDLNGDGQKQQDEPGLAGVTIYVDFNNNGQLDPTDSSTTTMADVDSTTADETGEYWLMGLPAGDHVVREIVPAGYTQTFPGSGFHTGRVANGDIVRNLNFGNQRIPAANGSVHGFKWEDLNGDGVWDNDEPGKAGVMIYIDVNGDQTKGATEPGVLTMDDVDSTAVDETGMYWLENVPPGTHTIREVVPGGYNQTFPPGGSHQAVITDGNTVEGLNFGNQRIPRNGSIRGTKWDDADSSGTWDNDENPLPGVTIYLDFNNNGTLDPSDSSTTTDSNGEYWFLDVSPGSHVVREIVPSGYTQTYPGGAGYHLAVIADGDSLTGRDFGNRRIPQNGSIHGTKWKDLDGNGRRDQGDHGLAGVTIYLDLNRNGVLDNGEPRTTSMNDDPSTNPEDETGMYWLENVPPGTYQVCEVVTGDYVQTFPANGCHTVVVGDGQTVEDIDFGNYEVPDPGPGECPLTQGYWENHDWPIHNLSLGTVAYNEAQLRQILESPVAGNGLISLAHQLIAAKLNVANGAAISASVAADILAADAMIGALVVPPIGAGYLHPSITSDLIEALDDFNNGRRTDDCGDDDRRGRRGRDDD